MVLKIFIQLFELSGIAVLSNMDFLIQRMALVIYWVSILAYFPSVRGRFRSCIERGQNGSCLRIPIDVYKKELDKNFPHTDYELAQDMQRNHGWCSLRLCCRSGDAGLRRRGVVRRYPLEEAVLTILPSQRLMQKTIWQSSLYHFIRVLY